MLKKILYISPGPNFDPHDPTLLSHYKYLSKYFCGYILTTTSKPEDFQIGNFRFLSMRFESGSNSFLKYRQFCRQHAQEFLKENGRFDLITTYDPLKSGLIATGIAKMHNAPFAPEINGVYTSPAEWVDEPYKFGNQIKKRVYPVIMYFVLKHAQGARLLFKGQIDPFNRIMRNKVVHDFSRWVNSSLFVPIQENKEVLFVGFPFKRKGVDVLIAAFKQIAEKYPDWRLKILGWYPDPTQLIKAIGRHPQIYHHPPANHDDMPGHIGSCGILVLPSRSEAMGRVLLEAMAAGKPRIASSVDGIPTVIEDGVDGLLCEPGNIDDLAQKLDRLIGNPELRKNIGAAGRERAKKEFTQEVYMTNLVNFYNAVIGSTQ